MTISSSLATCVVTSFRGHRQECTRLKQFMKHFPSLHLQSTFVFVPIGAIMEHWTPARDGADYELSKTLMPLREVQQDKYPDAALSFTNIRERAGWAEEAAEATPKIVALLAAAAIEVPPTPGVTLRSAGACLVYGRDEVALDAARQLSSRLDVTLLLTGPGEVLPPGVRDVRDTNECLIHVVRNGAKVVALAAIDNLWKGAAGQAVQNLNLMLGLDETDGLR